MQPSRRRCRPRKRQSRLSRQSRGAAHRPMLEHVDPHTPAHAFLTWNFGSAPRRKRARLLRWRITIVAAMKAAAPVTGRAEPKTAVINGSVVAAITAAKETYRVATAASPNTPAATAA